MTEYASPEPERRGIAVNRRLQCVLGFCEYQKTAEVEKQNKCILKENIKKELYDEIDRILPAIKYCLAPKTVTKRRARVCYGLLVDRRTRPSQRPRTARSSTGMQRSCMTGWTSAVPRGSVWCSSGRGPEVFRKSLPCIIGPRSVSAIRATRSMRRASRQSYGSRIGRLR